MKRRRNSVNRLRYLGRGEFAGVVGKVWLEAGREVVHAQVVEGLERATVGVLLGCDALEQVHGLLEHLWKEVLFCCHQGWQTEVGLR